MKLIGHFRGIIPPNYGWTDNFDSKKWDEKQKGTKWGSRYPVRIFGYHSEDKNILPDSQLPWVETIVPVTAGSGHGASYQSSRLLPGTNVLVAVYKPEAETTNDNYLIYIMGVFVNNTQTPLSTNPQQKGFDPISGFSPFTPPPKYAISVDQKTAIENIGAVCYRSLADAEKRKDGQSTRDLAVTSDCEKVPLSGIQIEIRNFIKKVTDAKLKIAQLKAQLERPIGVASSTTNTYAFNNLVTDLNNYTSVTSTATLTNTKLTTDFGFKSNATDENFAIPFKLGAGYDIYLTDIANNGLAFVDKKTEVNQFSISDYITKLIDTFSKRISTYLKGLITEIQAFFQTKIQNAFKDIYNLIFPNQREQLKDKIEAVLDKSNCLFQKIIKNLFKMCAQFLKAAVDYLINTPLCAVENFVGGLIGKIVGLITSALNVILQPLQALLGAFDIAESILGFVEDLFKSLTCDEKPSCAKIKEWSVWDGPEQLVEGDNLDVTSLIGKMKSFAANTQSIFNPNNYDFTMDFSDIFQDSCNVGPIFCGPPRVEFSGGGGTGASGNAIVNTIGQIIGVDITNPGRNYSSPPLVKFKDSCGRGSGAVGYANIGPVVTTITTIGIGGATGTIGSGTGIGATGGVGIGTTTTNGLNNVVITDPGNGYLPAPDGSMGGDGRTLSIPISPQNGIYPSLSSGQYPVILKLCEIIVNEPGFGYSSTDTVVIEPSNGATARAVVNSDGNIDKIEVLTKGEGFTELPTVYIQTSTGYRANLVPRLCVERIGDDLTRKPPAIEKIINVVDCPGRQ